MSNIPGNERNDFRAGPSATPMGGQADSSLDAAKPNDSSLSSVTEDIKTQAGNLADSAKGVISDVREKMTSTIEDQKSAGAEKVRGVADAVRRAATELEGEIPQAAQYVRMAATEIEKISTALSRRDIGDLIGSVQNFARRQPTAFLGIAALSGFALVRFLKTTAGSSGQQHTEYNGGQFNHDDRPVHRDDRPGV